ncbi:hypothetical protein [Acinetobacter sp. WCHAc060025]|uniref:hypothetical protein n=1 Tax=Acinetobacter sp. WCHAc060025 TaxID=2518625 RepID=UPI001023A9CA|nr:hypothetical protein [Acinetobacter sp. WCHAc060025]RZG71686.1 hypothetical protein EXE09_18295 [Acinetobacter sp. WCHAc060025]
MSLEITPNLEMEKEELKVIDTFIKTYVNKLLDYQSFNHSKAKEITKLLKVNLELFERKDTKKVLNYGEPLTAQQKRDLGINTRLKVNNGFLNFINIESIDKTDLFGFITEAEFYARARAWSEREINRAKKLKSTLRLNIDKESCPNSINENGIYTVKNAPLLPLATCGNKCLCTYFTEVSF